MLPPCSGCLFSKLYYTRMEHVYTPSKTEKGPLHPRDVEQARMPCFLGMDYPDEGMSYASYHPFTE